MRVLMTTDSVGGVWTYSVELARELRSRSVEVLLAVMGGRLSASQVKQANEAGCAVAESDYKLEWMSDPWQDVDASGDWLLELRRQFRPHVVHLNTYAHGSLEWRCPTLTVFHSCVHTWWRAVKGQKPPTEWDEYWKAVETGLKSVNMVVAPTNAMLEAAAGMYGVFRESLVVYNGRRAEVFGPADKQQIVFAAGRIWDQAKNLSLLDQAAGLLDYPVYLAGNQDHPEGGKAEAANCTPVGFLDEQEMAEWLSKTAVYALPARYEPFGLSVLEAALSECALVLGDIPTLREVWADAAIYVSPDDADGLADVLDFLLKNHQARKELAYAARKRAERYTAESFGRTYFYLYRHLKTRSADRTLAAV